jgi:hypothetical protein
VALAGGVVLHGPVRAAAETPDAEAAASNHREAAALPPTPDDIGRWIDELANDEYAVRQQAFEQLLASGMAARGPLLVIADGPDPETRTSARRLVALIDRSEFHRRLEAFAADTDGRQKLSLPGWEQYRKLVGGEPADRALFVEMQRHEGSLLSSVFGVSKRAPEDLWESRLQRIVQWQAAVGDRTANPPLGSCATMLFLGARREMSVSDAAVISIDSLFQRSPVRDTLLRDGSQDAFRRLVVSYVRNCPNNGEMALGCRLRVIAAAGLEEGLPLALAIAGGDPEYVRATPLTRANAASLVGQLGTSEHVDRLEPLLGDSAICIGMMGQVAGQNGATVQVRDVALVVMLHLTGQSPADYGYAAARLQPPRMFDVQTLYRHNDRQREEAIAKWRAWRAESKAK